MRERTTYSSVHNALRRVLGSATKYLCCRCEEPAAEWAYNHGDPQERYNEYGVAFSLNLDYYQAMCRRCHRVFDKESITECPQGHQYTPENTIMDAGGRKCKKCVYGRNRRYRKENPPTAKAHERKMKAQRARRARATPEEHRAELDRSNAARRAKYVPKRDR